MERLSITTKSVGPHSLWASLSVANSASRFTHALRPRASAGEEILPTRRHRKPSWQPSPAASFPNFLPPLDVIWVSKGLNAPALDDSACLFSHAVAPARRQSDQVKGNFEVPDEPVFAIRAGVALTCWRGEISGSLFRSLEKIGRDDNRLHSPMLLNRNWGRGCGRDPLTKPLFCIS